jgi:hypothetical protein
MEDYSKLPPDAPEFMEAKVMLEVLAIMIEDYR